jgi:hypothetical protein
LDSLRREQQLAARFRARAPYWTAASPCAIGVIWTRVSVTKLDFAHSPSTRRWASLLGPRIRRGTVRAHERSSTAVGQ